MTKLIKHISYIIFSVVMLSSLIIPVNAAASEQSSIEAILTNEYLESCTIEQLYDLSHVVEKRENVNAVFEELLKRVSKIQNNLKSESVGASVRSTTTASTNLIDNYISISSTSVSTSHVLKIVVNVKSNIPSTSYLNFTLGYEYPTACRTAGTMVNMSGRSKGTHIITINTKGLVSAIYVSANVVARDYTEHKHFKTLFDKPYSSHVAYQTITQTDVTLHKVTAAIPGVVLFFTPADGLSKLGKVTLKIVEALSIVTALDVKTPDLAVGQYYKTTTTYTSDYRCVVKLQIYSSKASYDSGSNPIHTSNSTINIPH